MACHRILNIVPCALPIFQLGYFFLILSFMCSLSILGINCLSDIFANPFSYSVFCLFVLLMVSFAVQKLFFKHLYWSIIALQWCVSFCFITK